MASCGGTTPSLSEYRQLIGTPSGLPSRIVLARGCIECAAEPIGCATSRYSAFSSGGTALPEASVDSGLPSVMTLRTHSLAW